MTTDGAPFVAESRIVATTGWPVGWLKREADAEFGAFSVVSFSVAVMSFSSENRFSRYCGANH